MNYRISQLAERTGMPASTLRFYEEAGLLAADRTPSGYRSYDESAVEQLGFISSAKAIGLSLDDIRDLLPAWQTGVCASVRRELAPMVDERLIDTNERISELISFSRQLRSTRAALSAPAPEGACGSDCGCTITEEQPAVACSLDGDDLGGRVDEWHRLLSTAVARHTIDGDGQTCGVTFVFANAPSTTSALAELIGAEQECCPFYTFSLHVGPDATTFEIYAPRDAQLLLDILVGGVPLETSP